ncbi:MAG: dioxygenase, partial [Caldimonas sp.]
MNQLEAGDITESVIDRMADCTDERFKTVMTALVKHAHAFLREVQPTESEWIGAIEFLTATGKKCDPKRQEFILLSDTLGISMLVVALNQLKAARALTRAGAPLPTEATVQGPFYWDGSPELELGADIGEGMPGEPA